MKKKNHKLKIVIISFLIVALLAAAAFGAASYFLYQKANSGLFFEATTLNGYDVAGRSPKEIYDTMMADYSRPKMDIYEKGENVMTLTLKDMGYTINELQLMNNIQHCLDQQNKNLLGSLFEGNQYEIEIPIQFDEAVFKENVRVSAFSVPRTPSVDAVMGFDGEQYYITPEVYGNEMDDADVQVIVRDAVDHLIYDGVPAEDMRVDIPEALYYVPTVTQDDPKMNRIVRACNQYCKAKITYTFGDVTEVVDWDTIQGWMILEGDEAYISEEALYEYVYSLKEKYDTLYYERRFTTTYGNTIVFPGSDYGYWIDEDAEVYELLTNIQSNSPVTREPIYSNRGFSRNGRDDFNGNYVEVNLSAQRIWLYRNGGLVVESDIVSGLPKDKRETATGIFTIPYKASPFNLKGGGGSGAGSWDVDVQYWMPFHDGQGLHDASWRGSFGGNIYLTNGSHGCVNLPTNVAAVIYQNIDSNFPIILYK